MRQGVLLTAVLSLMAVAGCTGTGNRPGTVTTSPPAWQTATSPAPADAPPLRVGYLATITHAQAVIGLADGRLAAAAGVPITTRLFHTGTTALTAMLAGELDLLYAGPTPAVNGFLRSGGAARIIAGSASGGTALVTRPGLDLEHLQDARLASPGLANTQDVALRHYLQSRGLRLRERGGTVQVLPLANPDILQLYRNGQIDGAWVPEPWISRLEAEAGARLALDERTLWPDGRFATTVVVASTRALAERRDALRGFLQGHAAVTQWLNAPDAAAAAPLGQALSALQGKAIPLPILAQALARVDFTTDPLQETIREHTRHAQAVGFLTSEPNLKGLFDLSLLEEVTR